MDVNVDITLLQFVSSGMEDGHACRLSGPPAGLSSDLTNSLSVLISKTKLHPNPFLIKDIKAHLYDWSPNKSPLLFLSEEFQQCYDQLIRQINELDKTSLIEFTSYMNKSCEKVQAETEKWWLPVDLFLNLASIKKLKTKLQKQMMNIISEAKSKDELPTFLKSIEKNGDFSWKSLEEEAKNIKDFRFKKIDTLLIQIIMKRPKQSHIQHFIPTLLNNQFNIESLMSHTLDIIRDKETTKISGKIIRAEAKTFSFLFWIKDSHGQKQIQMLKDESGKFISSVHIKTEIKTRLEDLLNLSALQNKKQEFMVSILIPQCVLQLNLDELRGSFFLPRDKYKIVTTMKHSQNIQIQFISLNSMNKYRYELIYSKQNKKYMKIKNMVNKETHKVHDFLKSYKAMTYETTIEQFVSLEDNNRRISISKANVQNQQSSSEVQAEMQTKKQEMMVKIASLDFQLQKTLIKKISRNIDISPEIGLIPGMAALLQEVVRLSQKLSKKASAKEIVIDLILQVNFAKIINKSLTIKTNEIIKLLAEAEKALISLVDKDVIVFYGNTGSGKSTLINYLLGIPLKKITKFGKEVFQIDTNELQQTYLSHQELEGECEIGHSNIFSKTAYSSGYTIPPEVAEQKLKYLTESLCGTSPQVISSKLEFLRVTLCDNPGFGDSRGIQYQICGHLSMDKTIQVCNKIKAIVLVVPFESITADRGTDFLKLIHNLQHKYPNLLNPLSITFDRFFILITKRQYNSEDMQNITQLFMNNLKECIRQIEAKNIIISENKPIKQKKQLYESLVLMCQEGSQRIDFVQLDDSCANDELLMKYVDRQKSIPKQEYRNAMMTNTPTKTFINEINIYIHNWLHSILQPFLFFNPKNILSAQGKIRTNQKKLQICQQSLKEMIQKHQRQKQQITSLTEQQRNGQLELERVKNGHFTQTQLKKINSPSSMIIIIDTDNYKKKLLHIECERQMRKHELKLQSTNLQEQLEGLTQLQKQRGEKQELIKLLEQKIRKLKEGHVEDQIINQKYHIGQYLLTGLESYTRQDRKDLMKRGQKIPGEELNSYLIAGHEQKKLCKIFKIQRKYRLKPCPEFDPKKHISFSNLNIGEHQAIIYSKHYQLQQIITHNDEKTMMLSVVINFPKTDDERELPFLRITHKISSAEYNEDTIRNLSAECSQLESKLQAVNEGIVKITMDIKNQKDKILSVQRNIDQLTEELNKIRQQQRQAVDRKQQMQQNLIQDKLQKQKIIIFQKQNKLAQIRSSLSFLKNIVAQAQKDIKYKRRQVQKHQAKIQQSTKHLQNLQFAQVKLALLMRDQLQKNIPQSLRQFIRIAKDKYASLFMNKAENCEKLQQSIASREQNFKHFQKVYKTQQKQLPKRIEEVLQQQ